LLGDEAASQGGWPTPSLGWAADGPTAQSFREGGIYTLAWLQPAQSLVTAGFKKAGREEKKQL